MGDYFSFRETSGGCVEVAYDYAKRRELQRVVRKAGQGSTILD